MKIEELLSQGSQEEVEEGAPAWMSTFADMATLLLTFFVLLLSFANMDAQKFREMLGSVKDAFGVQQVTQGDYMARSSEAVDSLMERAAEAEGQAGEKSLSPSMEQALAVVEALFQDLAEQGGIEVFLNEEGITVRVDGKLLFESGAAELKPGAEAVFARIGALLRKYTFDLFILGHTDSVPIQTARFPSNWELSGARASAGLRYLVERRADPRRLVAVGFADSRPAVPNDSAEGRARNRRVEFLFKNPQALESGEFRPAQP